MPPDVSDFDFSGYPPELRWLLESLTNDILSVTEELEKTGKTVQEWLNEIAGLLVRFHTAAYMSGKNSGVLTQQDRDNLNPYIKAQMEYLSNFGMVVQSEGDFQQGWYRRAASYARGIIAPYWKGAVDVLPLPAMPGDLTSQCGQLCACQWDIRVLSKERGDYDCYWVMNATREVKTEHCQTCLERARLWAPLEIRDMVLIIPESMIGGDVPVYEYKEFETIRGELENLIGRRLKHLPGKHDQLSHGYRYGSFGAAKRTLRRLNQNVHPIRPGQATAADYKRRARARTAGDDYALRKSIQDVERKIYNQPNESVYMLDRDGNILSVFDGDNKTVRIPDDEAKRIQLKTNGIFGVKDKSYGPDNEIIAIHNHPLNAELRRDAMLKDPVVKEYYEKFYPQLLGESSYRNPLEDAIPHGYTENDPFTSGATLSQQDLMSSLVMRYKEMRATSPWGRTYIMRFQPDKMNIDIRTQEGNTKFIADLVSSHTKANNLLSNAIKNGAINPREFHANFWHEVWLNFTNDHPEYHIEYTWEIDPARFTEAEAAREVIY